MKTVSRPWIVALVAVPLFSLPGPLAAEETTEGKPPTVAAEAAFQKPKLIHRVDPQYTRKARRAKARGTVILQGEIGTDGRVRDIKVLRGMGHGMDEAAVKALRQWRFEPAQDEDGKPVPVRYTASFNFQRE